MTPQDTANKIISKYFIMLRHDKLIEDVNLHTAKKCALIAVDEIINTIEYSSQADELSKISYWTEVKKEIESK
jgi:hypothetical protein